MNKDRDNTGYQDGCFIVVCCVCMNNSANVAGASACDDVLQRVSEGGGVHSGCRHGRG